MAGLRGSCGLEALGGSFGKLGPKIWLMMASKYELAKVAAVCAKHGLGFPDAPEFAQLAAATAAAVK